MSRSDLFPKLLVEMVTVGAESDTLDSALATAADAYEEATDERIAALTGIIQPAITILVAVMVGGIALSIIMPMYSIMGALE